MLTFDPKLQNELAPAPEEVWRQALTEFAASQKLPVDHVLAGGSFTCNGMDFRLKYNVHHDPDGMVVMLDLGAIPPAYAHTVRREMLAHNARRASLKLGYFGIIPGTERGALCVRLALRDCAHPAATIAVTVDAIAGAMDSAFDSVKSLFAENFGLDSATLTA
ncbi:MAG: hypothetical protein EOO28_11050 [Comamonadaceae bacterium]|nr:MAG: hypothetical protein EOO28_11050 [Comamonadaceae bacterium]